MEQSSQAKRFPWRLFWLFFVAGILGALAIIPLAIDLFGPTIAVAPRPSIPLPILVLIGVVQNLCLLALFVFLGLKLGRTLSLGAPLLESWLGENQSAANWKGTLKSGLLTGVGVGVVLLLIVLVLVPALPNLPFVTMARFATWKRVLACFYGGLYEEILSRLFLLTLFAWLLNRTWRKPTPQLSPSAFWIANALVALLFGLGHLPSASLVMPITPLVVVVALLLNGIAALAFGFLYWKRGLEAAMVAHFTADFVLYVVGSSLL